MTSALRKKIKISVALCGYLEYHEHMKDKNTLTLDEIIAARNIRIAEANRKAAEIAKRNLEASPYRH